MRHVFILATARTGGTWFGKVMDTAPYVKYLWEPDSHRRPLGERFPQWEHGDPEKMLARIENFEPHQRILPEFPKKGMTTAVYKLYSVCGDVSFMLDDWADEFLEIREKLDAKVIHLVRHPVRWLASVARWSDRPLRHCLELYNQGNRAFLERCAGQPWYKAVTHEDATRMSRVVFPTVLEFCNIVYDRLFHDFLGEMHTRDENPDPDNHSTIMTRHTVLMRWKDLDADDIKMANEMTDRYWSGIYEPLGRGVSRWI